jgi:sensor histidine kinase YesM
MSDPATVVTGAMVVGDRDPTASARSLPPSEFLGTALIIGIGLFVFYAIVRFDADDFVWAAAPKWATAMLRAQVTAFVMLLAAWTAERHAAAARVPRVPLPLALLAAGAAATFLVALLYVVLDGATQRSTELRWILYVQIENVLLAGAAVLAWMDRRRAQAAVARMHAAHLARVDATRRTLEAQLQAMQARIEPQFLFDTLARVKELYDRDAEAAERVLDELIAYLRAAMPRMRETSSTVGQEIDLVRAWLAILASAPGAGIDHAVDVQGDAREARLPAMLLLPLVSRVFAKQARRGRRYLRLVVARQGGRLGMRLTAGAAAEGAEDDDTVRTLRERLAALYGSEATLAFARRADGTLEGELDLPLEPAAVAAT